MRIIFFNIWHGLVGEPLKNFILKEAENADCLCLIEIHKELFEKFLKILPDFDGVIQTSVKSDLIPGVRTGQAILYRKNMESLFIKKKRLFKNRIKDSGGLLYGKFNTKGGEIIIGCIAGKPRPGNKLDTKARINQSNIIINTFKNINIPLVFGGDFNLMPETKSIKAFEDAGYKNLIKDFNIKETRNKLCWDQFPEEVKKFGKQHYADYCFVSNEVKVKNFEVPNIEASDHEPLIMDFEI